MTRHLQGRFAAAQLLGSRKEQEDDFGLLDGRDLGIDGLEHTLLVLADGMGGHTSGGLASQLATESVVNKYQELSGLTSERLHSCVFAANDAIGKIIAAEPVHTGMGCTLVIALISKRGLEWASVGDSPMWLYHRGNLRRLNADHSMAPVFKDMVDSGSMESQQAETDPNRNALRSAIFGEKVNLVDLSSQPVPIRQDDLLVLASDGLETLSITDMRDIIRSRESEPLQMICDALIKAVDDERKPNQDNTTVLLFRPENDWGEFFHDSEVSEQTLTVVKIGNVWTELVHKVKHIINKI